MVIAQDVQRTVNDQTYDLLRFGNVTLLCRTSGDARTNVHVADDESWMRQREGDHIGGAIDIKHTSVESAHFGPGEKGDAEVGVPDSFAIEDGKDSASD